MYNIYIYIYIYIPPKCKPLSSLLGPTCRVEPLIKATLKLSSEKDLAGRWSVAGFKDYSIGLLLDISILYL